jgi:ribosomal protein L31
VASLLGKNLKSSGHVHTTPYSRDIPWTPVELLQTLSFALCSTSSASPSIGSCAMSASVTDVASSCHPLAKGVQKHTCQTQFIHRLKPVVFLWKSYRAFSKIFVFVRYLGILDPLFSGYLVVAALKVVGNPKYVYCSWFMSSFSCF